MNLPDTIDPDDPKYNLMGEELAAVLKLVAAVDIAKSFHANLEQDLRDWLYDRILPYFSDIRTSEWSEAQSLTAEWRCRELVSFFQSICGVDVARERGHIATVQSEWYTNWLLRLNLGDSGAEQVAEAWVPYFATLDHKERRGTFAFALSKELPQLPGHLMLLTLYTRTLELRVQATTARAFGDPRAAELIHSEAVLADEKLRIAFREFFTGGAVGYVLSNDDGFFITKSPQYGPLFHVWTSDKDARELNAARCAASYQIVEMNYRDLLVELHRLRSFGMHNVVLDRRSNGELSVVPIDEFIQFVQQTINKAESTEFGKGIRREIEKSPP